MLSFRRSRFANPKGSATNPSQEGRYPSAHPPPDRQFSPASLRFFKDLKENSSRKDSSLSWEKGYGSSPGCLGCCPKLLLSKQLAQWLEIEKRKGELVSWWAGAATFKTYFAVNQPKRKQSQLALKTFVFSFCLLYGEKPQKVLFSWKGGSYSLCRILSWLTLLRLFGSPAVEDTAWPFFRHLNY